MTESSARANAPAKSSSKATRYNGVAMAAHWLLALGLIAALALGWYMTGLPFSPSRLKLYNWHKWLGVTLLTLSLLRLVWRITHRPPELPAAVARAMPQWQHWAHNGTHHAMYLLFFAVPLLGERLENHGIRGKQIRHRAVCVHLDHARGYKTRESVERNLAIRAQTRAQRITWTPYGIEKSTPHRPAG